MVALKASKAIVLIGAMGFASMYVLFTVAPVLAFEIGGSVAAGLATTVFMVFTIVAQLCTPMALRRFAPSVILGGALLLLAVPSLAYLTEPSFAVILVAAALRGVGFGLVTIVCTVLVTVYSTSGREGSALGVYGLSTSLTGVVAPVLGLVMLEWWRPLPAIFAFVIPVAGLFLLGVIRRVSPAPRSGSSSSNSEPRVPIAPMLLTLGIFFPVAIAYGSVYTFLPLATAGAAAALFIFGIGFAAGRLAGGRLVDTWTARAVLVPGILVATVGMVLLALSLDSGTAWIAVLPLGIAAGVVASSSLAGMMKAASSHEYGVVSTAWNLTFDLGIAIGGLGVGILVGVQGFSTAFLALGVLLGLGLVLGLVMLYRERADSWMS